MNYNKMIRLISGQQVVVNPVFPKPSLAIGPDETHKPLTIQENRLQAYAPPKPGPDYRRFRRERTLYYSPAPVSPADFPRSYYIGEALVYD